MRRLFIISGIVVVLLFAVLLTGWGDADVTQKEVMRKGNKLFETGEYQSALEAYEAGMAADTEKDNLPELYFNAAHVAYALNEYGKAFEYYSNADDSVEKYLNMGNICYHAGGAIDDINKKLEFYQQAARIYMDGIIMFPQDVPLKYNYELLINEIDELLDDQEQDGNTQNDDDEKNNDNQNEDSEDSESGDDGESNESGEEGKSEDSESEDSESDENNENSENGENEENNDNNVNDDESGESEDESGDNDDNNNENSEDLDDSGDSGEDNESSVDDGQIGEQEDNGEQGEESSANADYDDRENGDEVDLDQEAIARILRMLEIQEEQSLKNNQEVVGGNEGMHGW